MGGFFSTISSWIKSCFKKKKQTSLQGENRENLTTLSPLTNSPATQSVLRDFKKLNFEDSNCFETIAKFYKQQGKVSLFDDVVLRERKEIIKILDDKLRDLKRQEEFRKRLGEYLFLKINEGMNYGEELKNRLKCFEGRVEEVLSDFEKLRFDFEGNKCEDSSDSVNYNNGRAADPFDKIANYYRSKGNIFLFNFGILSKQKEIMNILDKKFTNGDQKENFKNRLSRYLLRIEEGMNDAKELLREDSLIGFFDGRYWPGENVEVNHYDNLNVNIVKSGQSLEISHLFTDKIERMERNKNEVKRVKIYSNDKLIVTVEKNDEQQRNYCFAKDATCDMEIKWSAEDEEGNSFNCVVILDVSSGQFYISKATIDGEDDKLGEVLELAKQNKDVLIKNEGLYGFLEKLLEQSQEEIVRIPSSTLHNLKLEPLSEKEIEEDEQREYENSWAASGRC